jgi:hypothetical protein
MSNEQLSMDMRERERLKRLKCTSKGGGTPQLRKSKNPKSCVLENLRKKTKSDSEFISIETLTHGLAYNGP